MSTDQIDEKETNPFYQLPFIPGGLPIANTSLPEFARYNFTNGTVVYHYDMFGVYGHSLAKVVAQNMPAGASVLSDSTAPGSGAAGIAHIFPKQEGTYNDLENTMANLLNFAAFGLPYVGSSLCGFAP